MVYNTGTIRQTHQRLQEDGMNISENSLRVWVRNGILPAAFVVKRHIYTSDPDSKPQALVESFLAVQKLYYSVGQDISLFLPRLIRLDRDNQPATFIFSGTVNYISRALALDFTESHTKELQQAFSEGSKLNQLTCVVQMQDITLARDPVQLVFRSKLRQHGDNTPIELWLLQPPNGVVGHLISYFGDCQVQEIVELPGSCKTAVARARTYKGVQTHAAKLLV